MNRLMFSPVKKVLTKYRPQRRQFAYNVTASPSEHSFWKDNGVYLYLYGLPAFIASSLVIFLRQVDKKHKELEQKETGDM
jgi:hypothetical protein